MPLIRLTCGHFTLVDEEDFLMYRDFKWYLDTRGYAAAYPNRQMLKTTNAYLGSVCLLHRLIMKTPPKIETDHKNGDRLDNRKENLRLCSRRENMRNQNKIRGLSKYKGVSKNNGKWCAVIRDKHHKRAFLGHFKSEEDAARAYDTAALIHHEEFAKTNKMLGLLP